MKPILSILLLCFFVPAISQHTRLNGYAVYVFDDKFDSYYSGSDYYEGKFKAGMQFGVGIEYLPGPMNGIELVYLNQQTKAPTKYAYPGSPPGSGTRSAHRPGVDTGRWRPPRWPC